MARPRLGFNDAVLFGSLVYACVDLVIEWETFDYCSRPIHKFLFTSYTSVALFRIIHWLGSQAISEDAMSSSDAGSGFSTVASELLLNLRHKELVPRAIANMTWLVGLPFFLLLTLLGTSWTWRVFTETPECMPTSTHRYFSLLWILLCYGWILVHGSLGVAALMLERMVRRAENRLQEIEDADMRSRWGAVGHIGSFHTLVGGAPSNGEGMSSVDIQTLPTITALPTEDGLSLTEKDCSICLANFEQGDLCRSLPGCSHTFHKACLDLWLLRRAECPLCKAYVMAPSA